MSSGAATSSYNFIEQMIQRQAKAISLGRPIALGQRLRDATERLADFGTVIRMLAEPILPRR